MRMFCFQCQETAQNKGCTAAGVCGKKAATANLQDLLIYVLKGIALVAEKAGTVDQATGRFLVRALFTTVTNVNFSNDDIAQLIREGLRVRDQLKDYHNIKGDLPDAAVWTGDRQEQFAQKAREVGVLTTENEDVRSLRELLTYGVKGIAAYADHAAVLDREDPAIYEFIVEALASTTKELSTDELVAKVMQAGKVAVDTMALLDEAHTAAYGHPQMTEVNIGVRSNPAILISGHDLKDMAELLEQTAGTGVDVYTHGEMLPAHYYPKFKQYDHFVGNYGGSWWRQKKEFEQFNGPILMTTNCLVPPKDSYKDRVFTTGNVGFPGVKHIPDRAPGQAKDFAEVIALAKKCAPPTEIETGSIVGGFAHHQVTELADTVVDAVKSGAIKRFVVMAGCDGRHKTRDYFTEVAQELPEDAVILTAGCAKYRYNKLDLGDIDGIPRVLDAGQCNDSYSLAMIALKLKALFELEDINELPISFDLAWYEQKAVTVLLALLHLGVKGIRLGPTLPAFLSANVTQVLVDKFDIKPIGTVKEDVQALMAGK